MFCKEQVAQLAERVAEIHARGAELVIVGNGSPYFARAFAEDHHLTTPVLTDPELNAYSAAQLKSGLGTTLGLKVARNAARALKKGFRQKLVEGTAMQQGGVFVITPEGGVPYAFVSDVAGDHPDVDDVLAALP